MVGETHVRGLYSRCAANGTPRAALEATSFIEKRLFFWFEQLTPVWPGLRHAVRPWSSGESRLEVRMSQRHLAKRDQSQSVHQSCGKLRLCGLDRPDTEAGGAVLEMVSAAACSAEHDKALVVEETSSLGVGPRCLVVLHGCRMT